MGCTGQDGPDNDPHRNQAEAWKMMSPHGHRRFNLAANFRRENAPQDRSFDKRTTCRGRFSSPFELARGLWLNLGIASARNGRHDDQFILLRQSHNGQACASAKCNLEL
jgi:hypothetical protein